VCEVIDDVIMVQPIIHIVTLNLSNFKIIPLHNPIQDVNCVVFKITWLSYALVRPIMKVSIILGLEVGKACRLLAL